MFHDLPLSLRIIYHNSWIILNVFGGCFFYFQYGNSVEPRSIGTYISCIEYLLFLLKLIIASCFICLTFVESLAGCSHSAAAIQTTFQKHVHIPMTFYVFFLEIFFMEPFIFLLLVHSVPAILNSCPPRNFFSSFLLFTFCFLDSTFCFSLVYSLNQLNIPYELSEKGTM